VLVLLRVRTPALHSDRARGSWAAVARDRTFVAVTALNATFMAAAIALMVELLPAFAKNVAGVGECLHAAVHGPLSADLAPPQLVGRYLALSTISWQAGWIVGPAGGGFFLQHAPLLLWPSAAGINLLCAGWALALERRLPEHVRLTPRGVEPEGFGAGAAG